MVVFENWNEKQFHKANDESESAINLADLYWQGLDPYNPLSKKLKKTYHSYISHIFLANVINSTNFYLNPFVRQ